MTDPRNVAHDKKVLQEKKHKGEDVGQNTTHAPQPGKKPHLEEHARDPADAASVPESSTVSTDPQQSIDKP